MSKNCTYTKKLLCKLSIHILTCRHHRRCLAFLEPAVAQPAPARSEGECHSLENGLHIHNHCKGNKDSICICNFMSCTQIGMVYFSRGFVGEGRRFSLPLKLLISSVPLQIGFSYIDLYTCTCNTGPSDLYPPSLPPSFEFGTWCLP